MPPESVLKTGKSPATRKILKANLHGALPAKKRSNWATSAEAVAGCTETETSIREITHLQSTLMMPTTESLRSLQALVATFKTRRCLETNLSLRTMPNLSEIFCKHL